MTTHKLKKNQFTAIREELLKTERTQAAIAADYQVSTTMVSVVNNARTWGNYLASVKAKHPIRGPVQSPRPASKVARAEQLGLKPVDRSVQRKEADLKVALQKLGKAPTREEFDRVADNMDLLSRKMNKLGHLPFIGGMITRAFCEAIHEHIAAKNRE